MYPIVAHNINNTLTTNAAQAAIEAYVARMYRSLPFVMFYLNFDGDWVDATISFYNEAEQDRWPVGKNERCVSVSALGLVASKRAGGSCLIETMREIVRDISAEASVARYQMGRLVGGCYDIDWAGE
jgi:hypothetical protein